MTKLEPTPTAQHDPEIIQQAVERVIQNKFHKDFKRIKETTREELLPHIRDALHRASREGIYQELTGGIIPSDEELREIIRNALPEEIRNKEKTETDQDQVNAEEAVEGEVTDEAGGEPADEEEKTEADTAEQEGEGEVIKNGEEEATADTESPDKDAIAQDEKDTESVDLDEGEEDEKAPDIIDSSEGEVTNNAGDTEVKAANETEEKHEDEKKTEKDILDKIPKWLRDFVGPTALLDILSGDGLNLFGLPKAFKDFWGYRRKNKRPRLMRRNFMKKGKGKGRTINGIPVEQMPNRGYTGQRRNNKFNSPAANKDTFIDKAA